MGGFLISTPVGATLFGVVAGSIVTYFVGGRQQRQNWVREDRQMLAREVFAPLHRISIGIIDRLNNDEKGVQTYHSPTLEEELERLINSDWLDFADKIVVEPTRKLDALLRELASANGELTGFFVSRNFLDLFQQEYGVRPASSNDLFFEVQYSLVGYPQTMYARQPSFVNVLSPALVFGKDISTYMSEGTIEEIKIVTRNSEAFPLDQRWSKLLVLIETYPAFSFAKAHILKVRKEIKDNAMELSSLAEGWVKRVVLI